MQWAKPELGSGCWNLNPVFPLSNWEMSGLRFFICEVEQVPPSKGNCVD